MTSAPSLLRHLAAPGLALRAAIALGFLFAHLAAFAAFGRARAALPFDAAPGNPPAFVRIDEPLMRESPARWNRLLVARWDSQHYMGTALRGFSQCPRQKVTPETLPQLPYKCDVNFYPTYGFVAGLVSLGGRLPIDWTMLAVSFASSFALLFLWTDRAVLRALGPVATYTSLALFNAFPTGFMLVTLMTEPLCLGLTFASFVVLTRRRWMLGAALAGAATAVRVSGAGVGAAYGAAILASLVFERPATRRAWIERLLALPLCGWGLGALMLYFLWKFGDPLIYFHSYRIHYYGYHHDDVWSAAFVSKMFARPAHEGWWIFLSGLFLFLGGARALAGFARVERVFLGAVAATVLFIFLVGSAPVAFAGVNRYMLLVFPLFFAMGKLFARRSFALVLWLALSGWAYWNSELCEFVWQSENETMCRVR